jgi:hypothetical protein
VGVPRSSKTVVATALGVGMGTLVGILASRSRPASSTEAPMTGASERSAPLPPSDSASNVLQSPVTFPASLATVPQAADSAHAVVPPIDGPTQFAGQVAAHEADAIDPAWAPGMERTILEQFRVDLPASVPGEVEGVECRTTTCLAKIKFESYAAALANWKHVLAANYHVPCAVAVNAAQPSGRDSPYRLPVLFDCTDSRANP